MKVYILHQITMILIFIKDKNAFQKYICLKSIIQTQNKFDLPSASTVSVVDFEQVNAG